MKIDGKTKQVVIHSTGLKSTAVKLVWFYGISNIVGYLVPNLVYTYILNI